MIADCTIGRPREEEEDEDHRQQEQEVPQPATAVPGEGGPVHLPACGDRRRRGVGRRRPLLECGGHVRPCCVGASGAGDVSSRLPARPTTRSSRPFGRATQSRDEADLLSELLLGVGLRLVEEERRYRRSDRSARSWTTSSRRA
jgi:hypothetical protein